MVGRGIDGVGTNHIGAKLLHDRNIARTSSGIRQRVGVTVAIRGFCQVLVDVFADVYEGPTLIGNTAKIAVESCQHSH